MEALVDLQQRLLSAEYRPYVIAFAAWVTFFIIGRIHLKLVWKTPCHQRNPNILTKGFYLIATVYTFLLMAVLTIIGFTLMVIIRLFTFPFDKRKEIVGYFFRRVGTSVVSLVPIWSFHVHGPLPYKGQTPRKTVIVCNHASMLDPFLISMLPWEMKWLSKIENFKIPFVGWCMSLAGDIPVLRGDKESAKSAMQLCADYLNQGMPVCIFPEGTRSENDELRPFKEGAFRLAIETEADILPIAIAGSHQSLPKKKRIFHPSMALVTCGTPISTKGMTMDNLEELKEKAREAIIELRKKISNHSSQ